MNQSSLFRMKWPWKQFSPDQMMWLTHYVLFGMTKFRNRKTQFHNLNSLHQIQLKCSWHEECICIHNRYIQIHPYPNMHYLTHQRELEHTRNLSFAQTELPNKLQGNKRNCCKNASIHALFNIAFQNKRKRFLSCFLSCLILMGFLTFFVSKKLVHHIAELFGNLFSWLFSKSTWIMPNLMVYPSAHSKLSNIDHK